MNKKNDILVKEYVKRLSDDDLKNISTRLLHRYGGDLGEAVEILQKNPDIDRWLATANSANVFFNMIDEVEYFVQQEVKKRFGLSIKDSKAFV